MERIFLTGAPGWLGTRFVELVSEKKLSCPQDDYQIRCFTLNGADVSALKEFGAEIIYGDLTKEETIRGNMKDCDYVVHAAGIIHPKKIQDFYAINYEGTRNILNEAIAAGVKRFVYISSNSPMGFNQRDKLFREEDQPDPYMNYGKSKHMAEQLVQKAAQEGKIETVIIRPCWFYGPRQPLRQTTFFKMIKKGAPIMFGNGNNLRSMSYVDNIVQGILLAMVKEGVSGQTYWIADEKPYTTNEIYSTVAELLGVRQLKPKKIPGFSSNIFEIADGVLQKVGIYQQEIHVAGEMARSIACSVDKAKRELGYKPDVSLKEGMRRSIEWCKAQGIEI